MLLLNCSLLGVHD